MVGFHERPHSIARMPKPRIGKKRETTEGTVEVHNNDDMLVWCGIRLCGDAGLFGCKWTASSGVAKQEGKEHYLQYAFLPVIFTHTNFHTPHPQHYKTTPHTTLTSSPPAAVGKTTASLQFEDHGDTDNKCTRAVGFDEESFSSGVIALAPGGAFSTEQAEEVMV